MLAGKEKTPWWMAHLQGGVNRLSPGRCTAVRYKRLDEFQPSASAQKWIFNSYLLGKNDWMNSFVIRWWSLFLNIMTSSNGSISSVTVPLCGESSRHRGITLTKGQWSGTLTFLCCQPEQIIKQTLDGLVIRDAMMVMWFAGAKHSFTVNLK